MSDLTKAFDQVFKDLRTDPYASEEETKALLVPDTRSAEEKHLHARMDERGAWEQGVDSFSVLRDIALELLTKETRTPVPVAIDGNTSDGYHTFNELYEFRKVYNAALFNEWAAVGKCSVHKSWRHHDGELCFGGGWFIVVAVLPAGQISNHYKAKDWDLFAIPEADRALFAFDGHTGADVVARLKSHTAQPAPAQEPVAAKKDAVFAASIEFIGTLTGMKPPPIEVAPPEVLKPFSDFTEKVCAIFATTPPAAPVQERCEHCDGTGDVHDQTGEWRGTCHCAKAAQPEPTGFDAEFLSTRLARVAKLAGVSIPKMAHEQIAEMAGTILGNIARKLEAAQPAAVQPVADQAFLERVLAAMEGVIDVADRKTTEFDALRSCVVDLSLMLHTSNPAQQSDQHGPVQYKCTVVDDTHPNGVPLSKWGQQPAQPQQPHYCLNCEELSKDLAALKKQPQIACCAECGKKDSDGWALYCVECMDKIHAILDSAEKKLDALIAQATHTQSPKNHGDI